MADIGNLLQQLVSEQQLQRSRVEELAQQVAQTQQGVAGTQVVTEHVVGEVVQQVQLAFSQQQQATTDQLTQLAHTVQGQQTGIDQMSQVISSVSALQQQMQALAQNVPSISGSSMSQAAAVGSSPPVQAQAQQPAATAAAVGSSPTVQAQAQQPAATPFGTVPGPQVSSQVPLHGPQLFNLAGSARVNPAVAYAIQQGAVDQKNLGKPSVYDGSKEAKQSFHDWQDTMVTFLDASMPGIWEVLEWIANDQPKTTLDKDAVKRHFPDVDPLLIDYADSNIYACLSSYTGGEPKALVKQARRPNGFEAWRKLHARFNPATVGRQRASLTRITSPPENVPLGQLGGEIIAWENRIIEYEARPGSDVVSENLKIATVIAMCPGKLREHLNLNSHRFKTYQDIREEIFGYLETTYQVSSTAMDLGAVIRKKGPCWICGGEHLAFECRKGGGKGKGKGAKGSGKFGDSKGKDTSTGKSGGKGKGGGKPGGGGKGAGKGKPAATSTTAYCPFCRKLGHSKEQCWHKPKSLASIDPQLSALQSAFAKAAMEVYQNQQSSSSQSVPVQLVQSTSTGLSSAPAQTTATPSSTAAAKAAAAASTAGAPVSHLQVRRLNSLYVYLPGRESVNSLTSAPSASSHSAPAGSYRVQATLDSGAAASVAPKQAFPDYPIRATESSEGGLAYAAANGGLVHDEGRVEPVFTTDEGLMLAVGYSVADVHKVLTSAASVCNKGFGIWLDGVGCESYIIDKTTGDKIMLWQEDGVYVYNMNVLPNASTDFPWQA